MSTSKTHRLVLMNLRVSKEQANQTTITIILGISISSLEKRNQCRKENLKSPQILGYSGFGKKFERIPFNTGTTAEDACVGWSLSNKYIKYVINWQSLQHTVPY